MKRYVYMLEPSDRAELNDDHVGLSDTCPLDDLAERQFLAMALLRLSERQERVVRLRYGIGGVGEHTLKEIGEEIGTGREQARRILEKALRRLRYHARSFDPQRCINDRKVEQTMQSAYAREPERKTGDAGSMARPGRAPDSRVAHHRPTSHSTGSRQLAHRVSSTRDSGSANARSSRSEPAPPFSGIILLLVLGCFLFVIGFDSATAYNLTAELGAGIALFLHGLAVSLGAGIVTFALDEARFHDQPNASAMNNRWIVALCLTVTLGAVFGILDPCQDFLNRMVAATPVKFQSSTALIVMSCSTWIVLIGIAYICGLSGRIRVRCARNWRGSPTSLCDPLGIARCE